MPYKSLEKSFARANIIDQISSILSWDTSTFMPRGASERRGIQLAFLSKQARSIIFNNNVKKHLLAAKQDTRHLNEWQLANLKGMERVYNSYAAVPASLQKKLIIACNKSEMIWREARAKSSFKLFLPALTKVIALMQDAAKYRSDHLGMHDPYEALVDIYDPGRKLADIDKVFKRLEEFLPDFIKKVSSKRSGTYYHPRESVDPEMDKKKLDSRLRGDGKRPHFDIEKQKALGLEVMKAFGFNFDKGRLDVSTHPFCGGHFGDTRITTRYDEKNLLPSLYGVIHETGHALYEQNKPSTWADQPVGSAMGMAIHESQSLFAENQIGTSRAFVEFLHPKIVKLFELDAKTFSVDHIYSELTHVKPSFIRVEADEVTYPLHIMLRYKMEKMFVCFYDINRLVGWFGSSTMGNAVGQFCALQNPALLSPFRWSAWPPIVTRYHFSVYWFSVLHG